MRVSNSQTNKSTFNPANMNAL